MFKQIFLLIVLSVVAILFKAQLAVALKFVLMVHTQIAHGLGMIFAFDKAGEIVQSVIALLLIPIVIAVLIAIAHFFIRKAHFPHVVTVVWFVWVILLTTLVSHTVYTNNMVNNNDVHLMHENGPAHMAVAKQAPSPYTQGGQPLSAPQ